MDKKIIPQKIITIPEICNIFKLSESTKLEKIAKNKKTNPASTGYAIEIGSLSRAFAKRITLIPKKNELIKNHRDVTIGQNPGLATNLECLINKFPAQLQRPAPAIKSQGSHLELKISITKTSINIFIHDLSPETS
jgi:hypothetical protein